MQLQPEILEIRRAFLRILGVFILSFLILFAVPFNEYRLGVVHVPALPGGTVAVWVIGQIHDDLLPEGSSLISLSPLDPFFAESSVAAMLALVLVMPFIAYEFWRFVAPGLHTYEKRGIAWFFVSGVVMLGIGAVFAYVVLLPFIMLGLHGLNPAEVIPLYGLRTVVSLVTGAMLATSLIFLLPLFMILLTRIGLVPAAFWRTYARHALLISLIVSAIITPDGSGMSMIILAIPISILYGLGHLGSAFYSGNTFISGFN